MSNSILTAIKKALGIAEDYEHFDPEIIMHINSVFMILAQLGVGPTSGFRIENKTAVWTDFIEESSVLDVVKTYIYLKVRILFDPPSSAAVLESMNRTIQEYEWRLNAAVDPEVSQNE